MVSTSSGRLLRSTSSPFRFKLAPSRKVQIFRATLRAEPILAGTAAQYIRRAAFFDSALATAFDEAGLAETGVPSLGSSHLRCRQ